MLHGDVLGERARLSPDKVALIFVPTGERLTYRELDERALACAATLRGLGLEKGDRVGLLAHNRPEFLDVFLAAGKSGIVVVPLGTRLTAHELAFIVRDAGLRALVYDGAFAETIRALRAQVELEHWLALDESADHGYQRLSEVVARGEGRGERGEKGTTARMGRSSQLTPLPSPLCPVSPEDPYCLLYTSGTTGRPKGVILPHRMIAWNAYNTVMGWQLREDDVAPIFTPLYHAGGVGVFLLPLFAIGGTIVLHAGFDASEVWRTIERERCTVVFGVPTIWKLLMEAPEFASVDLSRVRWMISGGAPLPLYIIEAYQRRGVVFRQGYGLTEVGVNCFAMSNEDSVRRLGAIGRPLPFTSARLLDEKGGEVAVGEVGELCLRGPHVCAGYWNNPEATAAALDDEAFFHTGDLARRDEEGFFTIAGRRKDMIISGGVNIYPAEIEGELLLHPAVQDAAVVGVPDETWGEAGVAFVVLRSDAAASSGDLNDHLASRLARYKLPKRFVFVDSLPRTPYGKVVKGELRDKLMKPGSGVRGPGSGKAPE